MTRLIDCEVFLQESCLHVWMQVRQSHYFIVVMVKRETPVHTLRQCLNVQCEVASPNRSHKYEFVELALQDS